MADMPKDKLVVKGLGKADGTYEFDLFSLIDVGAPDSIDNREQHRITVASGVRPAELQDAVLALNAALMVSLAGVILARNGKAVNEERIWSTRLVYAAQDEQKSLDDYKEAIMFEIVDRLKFEEDAADPPEVAPLLSEQPLTSGGALSNRISGNSENGLSPTGLQGSEKSATSAPVTSVT